MSAPRCETIQSCYLAFWRIKAAVPFRHPPTCPELEDELNMTAPRQNQREPNIGPLTTIQAGGLSTL